MIKGVRAASLALVPTRHAGHDCGLCRSLRAFNQFSPIAAPGQSSTDSRAEARSSMGRSAPATSQRGPFDQARAWEFPPFAGAPSGATLPSASEPALPDRTAADTEARS